MKCLSSKKGQSLVETALILPVIVLVLTGMIDFGIVFNNYLVITNASREGARLGAVGASDIEIGEAVRSISNTLNQSQLSIDIQPSEQLRKKGDEVTVRVRYDNSLLTPIISAWVTNPLQIEGKTVMRVE